MGGNVQHATWGKEGNGRKCATHETGDEWRIGGNTTLTREGGRSSDAKVWKGGNDEYTTRGGGVKDDVGCWGMMEHDAG